MIEDFPNKSDNNDSYSNEEMVKKFTDQDLGKLPMEEKSNIDSNTYTDKSIPEEKNPFGPKIEDEVVIVSSPPYAMAALKKAPPSPYDNNIGPNEEVNKEPLPQVDLNTVEKSQDNIMQVVNDDNSKLNNLDDKKILEDALKASNRIFENKDDGQF